MTPLRVVLFSGGRGAGTIVEALLADPRVSLTIAINGYDDGASTGVDGRTTAPSPQPYFRLYFFM